MARGHQAYTVDLRQFPLGGNQVARLQLAGIDAAADGRLNPFIGWFFTASRHRSPSFGTGSNHGSALRQSGQSGNTIAESILQSLLL
jgi:hypothetical protein